MTTRINPPPSKNSMRNTITYVLLFLILVTTTFAESMLVTISAEDGDVSIRHVEIIQGDTSMNDFTGSLALVYAKGSAQYFVTSFDLPLLNINHETKSATVEEYTERTLVAPFFKGTESLIIYNSDHQQLATISLDGLSKVGDVIGPPPKDSIAFRTGQESVSTALNGALSSNKSLTSISDENNGLGLGFLTILAVIAIAVFIGYRFWKAKKN